MYSGFLLICSTLFTFINGQGFQVTTNDGIVSGRQAVTTTNKPYYAFQGVPYASPPIGDLRFKPPVPPQKWTNVLDTTWSDVLCFQVSHDTDTESEDCLYLNIYTPHIPSIDGDNLEPLPVMFYIFGGGFYHGDSLFDNYGPEYLLDRDVILVTINYRLGAFGFLATGDGVVPGNMGLKDQNMALKWIFYNIAQFGGDNQKITIFGQSAGCASVAYHLSYPLSRGLFRGAICESGSFLTPWSFTREPKAVAYSTAKHVDPNFDQDSTSEELLEFLMRADARAIDRAGFDIRNEANLENRELTQGHFYGPVIEPEGEGAVFTRKQYGILKDGDFARVPIIVGIVSEEAIIEAGSVDWLRDQMVQYDANLRWLVPNSMRIQDDNLRLEMGERIRNLYVGDGRLQDNLPAGIKYWSDDEFARPIIKFGKMLSAHTDVYFYQFSYEGPLGNQRTHLDGAGSVGHCEELPYIFRMKVGNFDNSDLNKFPLSDEVTQKRILKMWTDFAKFLHPTPEPSELLQNLSWPKVTPDDYKYLDFGVNLEIKTQPKSETFPQWEAMFDSLGYDDFDNY